ncbi:MAG: zinc metallopeptidase [Bacteroidota bacterium]
MNMIGILLLLASVVVGSILRNRFNTYAKTSLKANYSGAEIANKMLREHGIDQVKITCIRGHLTDHYNPLTQTVNLSSQVYYGKNAAAAAVAAHECGHAVQHARGYAFLQLRSTMVPVLSATTHFMPWIIMLGISLINTTLIPLTIGIALFALTTLFSLITLPVEFDASNRALAWMDNQGVVTSQEHQMANNALWWAAMTYVVAALGSLAQLLHLVNILASRRRA